MNDDKEVDGCDVVVLLLGGFDLMVVVVFVCEVGYCVNVLMIDYN